MDKKTSKKTKKGRKKTGKKNRKKTGKKTENFVISTPKQMQARGRPSGWS